MESQEESEMMQDFGSIVRAVMGSGMQMAENAQRRAHMRLSEANAAAEHERTIAQTVHRDFSSAQFWKNAGSEAIADRMIVASELAGRSKTASQAFMVGADRIRNQFGINVEDINRDHPTAATDRHRALRDALDDYLAGQRANAESSSAQAERGRDGSLADAATADPAGKQSENPADEVAEAKQSEDAQLGQAERFEGEENLDRINTETAEAKEVTAQEPGANTESSDAPQGQNSPAAQRLLTVWKDKGGKDADFPLAPTTANPQRAMKNRKRVMAGAAPARTQGQELSR